MLVIIIIVIVIAVIIYKNRGKVNTPSYSEYITANEGKKENMTREEEFEMLSKVVGEIIHDGYMRHQGNTCKRVANVLQIKSCNLTYKTLSGAKKLETRNLLVTSKPMILIGFSKIEPDGTVEFKATANVDSRNEEELNYLNTGDRHGVMIGKATSELIKNNPDINIQELIKTLEKRC